MPIVKLHKPCATAGSHVKPVLNPVAAPERKRITTITPNPLRLNGCAVAITAPGTGLKIRVVTLTNPTRVASAIRLRFSWEGCEIYVVLSRTRIGGTFKNPVYRWNFVTSNLHTPFFHQEHELPSTALFILEVHRLLGAIVQFRSELNWSVLKKL